MSNFDAAVVVVVLSEHTGTKRTETGGGTGVIYCFEFGGDGEVCKN